MLLARKASREKLRAASLAVREAGGVDSVYTYFPDYICKEESTALVFVDGRQKLQGADESGSLLICTDLIYDLIVIIALDECQEEHDYDAKADRLDEITDAVVTALLKQRFKLASTIEYKERRVPLTADRAPQHRRFFTAEFSIRI